MTNNETPDPELVKALYATASAIITALGAWIVRKLEKSKLRKSGKLND